MNDTWVTGSFDPLINTFLLLSCNDKNILAFYAFFVSNLISYRNQRSRKITIAWGVSYSPPVSSTRNLNNVQMWRVHRYYHCISLATLSICLLSHRSHHLIILVFLMILSHGAGDRSVLCVTDYVWVGREDQKVLVVFSSGSLNYYWLHLSKCWILFHLF